MRFNLNNLSDRTKIMHETQAKWRDKNWKNALKNNDSKIEELLEKIELLDIWRSGLPNNEVVKSLMREIYMDAYVSIHFSCFGLYKSAYMCLRSEFETILRLIYFSNHPVEFKWWKDGNEKWIRDLLKGSDVWGNQYSYLRHINEIKSFDELNTMPNEKFFGDNGKLKLIYSTLSKHVHSIAPYLQTKRSGSFSPKYIQDEFDKWYENFKNVQIYINTLLALGFPENFKKLSITERNKILDIGISSLHYKNNVKQTLGI